jgi:hypothetical protein
MKDTTPVFVHAWWRSSSTYVWSKLRQNPGLCCYYEPLHERIASLDKEAVSASPESTISVALRHPVADRNYFAEYFDFPTSPVARYLPQLAYDRYLLRAGDDDPALHAYINALVTTAAEAGKRPVLCFCRSQMRSAWMKRHFGGIHLAQIRNPASQWASFQVSPYFTQRLVGIGLKLCGAFPQAFAHIRAFDRQTTGAPADRGGAGGPARFSIAAEDTLRLFLLIWLASSMQAIAQADRILDVDRLAIEPAYRESASRWFSGMGCEVDFSDCSTPGAGTGPGRPGFHAAVQEAVQAMRTHAGCLVSDDANVISARLADLSQASAQILLAVLSGDKSQ